MKRPVGIEICIDSVRGAHAARVGGADRVELCADLLEGGTTPSAGMIVAVRQVASLQLAVMIRPRGGDFIYDEQELQVMEHDIHVARDSGADCLVFGALTPDGTVDRPACQRLLGACQGTPATFHRAFDLASDPLAALADLVDLGFHRLLTSGQQASAPQGAPLLRTLVELAGQRISIMPGGGIRPENVRDLVDQTGCPEVHLSATSWEPSPWRGSRQIHFGPIGLPPVDRRRATSSTIVGQVREALGR